MWDFSSAMTQPSAGNAAIPELTQLHLPLVLLLLTVTISGHLLPFKLLLEEPGASLLVLNPPAPGFCFWETYPGNWAPLQSQTNYISLPWTPFPHSFSDSNWRQLNCWQTVTNLSSSDLLFTSLILAWFSLVHLDLSLWNFYFTQTSFSKGAMGTFDILFLLWGLIPLTNLTKQVLKPQILTQLMDPSRQWEGF